MNVLKKKLSIETIGWLMIGVGFLAVLINETFLSLPASWLQITLYVVIIVAMGGGLIIHFVAYLKR